MRDPGVALHMYGQATFDKGPKKFSKEVSSFHLVVLGQPGKYHRKKVNFNSHFLCKKKKMYLRWLIGLKHKRLEYEMSGRKERKSCFHRLESGRKLEEIAGRF